MPVSPTCQLGDLQDRRPASSPFGSVGRKLDLKHLRPVLLYLYGCLPGRTERPEVAQLLYIFSILAGREKFYIGDNVCLAYALIQTPPNSHLDTLASGQTKNRRRRLNTSCLKQNYFASDYHAVISAPQANLYFCGGRFLKFREICRKTGPSPSLAVCRRTLDRLIISKYSRNKLKTSPTEICLCLSDHSTNRLIVTDYVAIRDHIKIEGCRMFWSDNRSSIEFWNKGEIVAFWIGWITIRFAALPDSIPISLKFHCPLQCNQFISRRLSNSFPQGFLVFLKPQLVDQ